MHMVNNPIDEETLKELDKEDNFDNNQENNQGGFLDNIDEMSDWFKNNLIDSGNEENPYTRVS